MKDGDECMKCNGRFVKFGNKIVFDGRTLSIQEVVYILNWIDCADLVDGFDKPVCDRKVGKTLIDMVLGDVLE